MLTIRLQRVGRVHEPTFRVVLVDSKRGPKSGRTLEILGNHDTRKAKNNSNMDAERINYWISKGAQLSDTMRNLLISKKVITGKKVNALPKKRPVVKELTEEEKKAASDAEAKAKADKTAADAPSPAEVKNETPVEAKEEVPSEAPVEKPTEEVKAE